MTSSRANDATLLVVQYHRVGEPCLFEYPGMTVSPKVFAEQIGWLKANGFTSITSAQWSAVRLRNWALPTKPILLIFDDGYRDLATYAFPVLQQASMSCAVGLVTSEIGGINRWDVAKGYQEHRLLDAAQINHWGNHGVEFMSHSNTHADLEGLTESEIESELTISKSTIAQVTSQSVTSLAYPYARTSEKVVRLAEKHYELAFSGIPGVNTLSTPRCLQRRVAAPQTLWRFRWVVTSAAWGAYHRIRERIHLAAR
jgi:peptidoglycan/xylan/chitin deacetylase (PgdA/CDA1 family)